MYIVTTLSGDTSRLGRERCYYNGPPVKENAA